MPDDTTAARPADAPEAFDLAATPVHLGLGARATPLPGFTWTAEYLDAYDARFASDGDEGRLVTMGHSSGSWSTWERHPAGEEVVVLLSGQADLIQRIGDAHHRVALQPGDAVVNPPGVWHTVDVHEAGDALFITPGRGTEHETRQPAS